MKKQVYHFRDQLRRGLHTLWVVRTLTNPKSGFRSLQAICATDSAAKAANHMNGGEVT